MDTYLFHRHRSEWLYAHGTAAQARAYWNHLNAGRGGNLWAVRRHGGKLRGINLANELAKIEQEVSV